MWNRLKTDIEAVFERDPAARSTFEVIFTYSGLHAIWMHRLAHSLYKRRLFFLGRLISQISRFLTGIEIHPNAKIGKGLFIDHGTGVVIGETCEIGDYVTLYQGVTLGGTGKERGKRHPTIEDHVVITTGAKVLGSIRVGHHSIIGAGSVVLKDVPPNSTVVGIPGRVVKLDGRRIRDDFDYCSLPDPVTDILRQMQREIEQLKKEVEQVKEGKKEKEYVHKDF